MARNRDTGKYEISDYSFGTFSGAYTVGSTVKMATLLTGYQEGGAWVGETKMDEGLQFLGDTVASSRYSVFNRTFSRVPINDIEAIGRSSNVYMWKTAIGIGNGTYQRGKPLSINWSAFDTMQNSFESFGLGSLTGVDLPGEVSGYTSRPSVKGNILDYAIGQFATYTTLQLAQYVSTIANDGYRVAPKVLKEVREPSPDGEVFGRIADETPIKVLNRINNTEAEIARIQQGMYYTYYGARGTARTLFQGADFKAAGKTGTAQDVGPVPDSSKLSGKRYVKTITLSHVGYAPFDNPEIAYAVIIPSVSTNTSKYPAAQNAIVEAAVMKYFELKEKKEKNAEIDEYLKIKQPFNKDDVLEEDESIEDVEATDE